MPNLVGESLTRKSMATLRADIADLQERLDDTGATAERLPHRRKYLNLVIAHLRRVLALHLELVAAVEAELAAGEPEAAG